MDSQKSMEHFKTDEVAFLSEPEAIDQNTKVRYPIGIAFIITSKIFERFTYLGIQSKFIVDGKGLRFLNLFI